MKRIITLVTTLFLALPLLAQAPAPKAAAQPEPKVEKADDFNTTREFKNRVFELKHRSPSDIASALNLLGSGFRGAGMNVNNEMKTITVRDFPENIATIEDAIRRLDRPAPPTPGVALRISVLIGSKSATPNAAAVPADLAPVVKELQSTLAYSHYALVASNMHNLRAGRTVMNNGVAEPAALGGLVVPGRTASYEYRLSRVSVTTAERPSLVVDDFGFEMGLPLAIGNGGTEIKLVRLSSPVTVRDGETVVIGTSTMGERALIVVVSADIETMAPAQ